MKTITKTREVVNVISAREVLKMTMQSAEPVECHEHKNGTWTVWYADPGWIPCPPVCELRHSHEYSRRWIQTNYKPTSFEDAYEWAASLCEGDLEPKVVKFGERSKDPLAVEEASPLTDDDS